MIKAYTELGFDHILDPQGYDHILFVVALCAIYLIHDWKKILILVTAFTIGHSLTLALSSLKILNISATLVETLIPITIILTCMYNIWQAPTLPAAPVAKKDGQSNLDVLPINQLEAKNEKVMANYGLALGFGLIHGLGFSNYFKSMLGRDESIIMPLLSFNIGVELGQIVIVLGTLIASFLIVNIMKISRIHYTIVVSIIIVIWSIFLMI
ncbi:MAG: hypothetical protein ACJA1A_001339 [Saprospiraceae bacterium]|jgi:hypothetical protein